MSHWWVLYPTSLCTFIVNVCYINESHDKKKRSREFHIDFNDTLRYCIKVGVVNPNRPQHYQATITKNDNRLIAIIDFDGPDEFCKKLYSNVAPEVSKFVSLLLDRIGLKGLSK